MNNAINKILEYLYIGNIYATNESILAKYDIKVIINCTTNNNKFDYYYDYLQFPLVDPPSDNDIYFINNNFHKIVLTIDKYINNNKNVLVYCQMGSQRSATIVAIYLMLKFKLNCVNAIKFIKSKRAICFFKKINFIKSLLFIENTLKGNLNKNNIKNKQNINTQNIKNPYLLRKAIYEQNIKLCINGILNIIPFKISEKIVFDLDYSPEIKYEDATICILDMDCLDIAKLMKNNDFNVVVLNMADESFPGGGIKNGGWSNAPQEESLLCRSNYFRTLNTNTGFYPINGPFGIYSEDVFIFRNKEFEILDKPFHQSFIATAAIKNPDLDDNLFSDEDYKLTFMKIDTIFQIAQKKSFDSIILGAFGSYYNNPIYQIVEIFNECIERWKNSFKMIIFAISQKSNIVGDNIAKNNIHCDYTYYKNCIKYNTELNLNE